MKKEDEYIWSNYHNEYVNQLEGLRKEYDFFIKEWAQTDDSDRQLVFNDKLHDNWKELYSTVFYLRPENIMEVGCGACYHLKNLSTIMPVGTSIGGIDLLVEQLEYGKKFSDLPPTIIANLFYGDVSSKGFINNKKFSGCCDFVYSHAVLMHMSTERVIQGLRNMAKMSTRYIMLIEGVANHENWFHLVQNILPDFEFRLTNRYIQYGILLTKRT